MAVDSNQLTTLAVLKSWLGISVSTDDTILGYAIDRASKAVQAYCGRNFTSQRYLEIYDGATSRLALYQNPVVSIRNIGTGWDSVASISATNATDVFVSVSVLDASILLHRVTSAGAEVDTTATFAAYPTSALMAAYISTVSGFSASNFTDVDIRYVRKLGGRNLKRTTAYFEAPTDSFYDYQVDLDAGIVHGAFLPTRRSVLVDYTAGFAVIPEDVEQASTSIAARFYHARARDSGLASESLGGYSYSAGPSSVGIDALERELLAPWRRIR